MVNTLIIGAGPAGLSMAALLKDSKLDFTILEKEKTVGGVYAKIHPSIQILSPADLCEFPLLKANWPRGQALKTQDYLNYLIQLKNKYKLEIQTSTKAEDIDFIEDRYLTRTTDGKTFESKNLVLAAGMMSFPNELNWNQKNNPQVEYQYASEWKGPEYYKGKNVLFVGSGVTAAELAVMTTTANKVIMATNKKIIVLPQRVLGIDIYGPLKWFERLPRSLFPKVCNGKFEQPIMGVDILGAIEKGLVEIYPHTFQLTEGELSHEGHKHYKIDVIINCTGYQFGTDLFRFKPAKRKNNLLDTKNNQSISHKGLYVLGHHCARKINSSYLRGIRDDIYTILKQIENS